MLTWENLMSTWDFLPHFEGTKRGSTCGKNSVNNTARLRKRQYPSQEGHRICPSIIILPLHDLIRLVTASKVRTTDNNAEYQLSG
jgi:hypothetical protein